MLCLDTDLYLAFIKLQANMGLGRAYAGLLPYVDGLYHMGYIDKAVYDTHVKRYSEPLRKKDEKKLWSSLEEKRQAEGREKAEKTLKGMIAQFDYYKDNPGWLKSAAAFAERFGELGSLFNHPGLSL